MPDLSLRDLALMFIGAAVTAIAHAPVTAFVENRKISRAQRAAFRSAFRHALAEIVEAQSGDFAILVRNFGGHREAYIDRRDQVGRFRLRRLDRAWARYAQHNYQRVAESRNGRTLATDVYPKYWPAQLATLKQLIQTVIDAG